MSSITYTWTLTGELRATIVEYENQPDECTLHPVVPSDDTKTTAWITAESGSYVGLDACR
jgi:hypothetical protein